MNTKFTITTANIFNTFQEVHAFLESEQRLKMHKQHRHQAKDGLNVALAIWEKCERNDEKKLAEIIRNLKKAVFLIEKTGYEFKG